MNHNIFESPVGMKNLGAGILVLAFVFAGCLISERDEYVLKINPDGKTGTLTSVNYNVQSDAANPSDQNKDFKELIRKWKSDDYLLDQLKEGRYVKERSVRLQNGKITWREVSLVSDLGKIFPHYSENDTNRFVVNPHDNIVTETNGTIRNLKDSLVIIWSPHTKMFTLKTKVKDYTPASKLEARLKKYLNPDGG
ncbi:MAG: hypothetical protein ACHQQQ_10920 [Bacteroidota bacterium]